MDFLSTKFPFFFFFIQTVNLNTKKSKHLVRQRRKAEEVRRKEHMVKKKKREIKERQKYTGTEVSEQT